MTVTHPAAASRTTEHGRRRCCVGSSFRRSDKQQPFFSPSPRIVMLDILGNVFGRSKKDKGVHTPGSPSTASSSGEAGASDGFAVVGQDANGHVPFIYPTMLTNEMLRPSTASATTAAASSTSSSTTPFASEGTSFVPVTQNTNTWNSHTDNLTLLRNMNGISHINAMDQVPFVPHAAYDSSRSSAGPDTRADDIRRCHATIDRVTGLLAAPSQSEYNFALERSVIRETSASSWQTFP